MTRRDCSSRKSAKYEHDNHNDCVTYKKTPMIHFRKLQTKVTVDFFVIMLQFVSLHGWLGVNDGRINAKGKGDKSQKRRNAGIGFNVKSRQQNNLINETQLLWVSDCRWLGMQLLHLEGHDIVALFVSVGGFVVAHDDF